MQANFDLLSKRIDSEVCVVLKNESTQRLAQLERALIITINNFDLSIIDIKGGISFEYFMQQGLFIKKFAKKLNLKNFMVRKNLEKIYVAKLAQKVFE